MTNEYGVKIGRNGYAPSILKTEEDVCYWCFVHTKTARHEVFFGEGRRPKSKRLGLWVNLCPYCHGVVHNVYRYNLSLQRDGQEAAMQVYGWDIPKCIKELGKNYLEEINV